MYGETLMVPLRHDLIGTRILHENHATKRWVIIKYHPTLGGIIRAIKHTKQVPNLGGTHMQCPRNIYNIMIQGLSFSPMFGLMMIEPLHETVNQCMNPSFCAWLL